MDIDVVANLDTNIEETQSIDVEIKESGPQGMSAYQIYLKNGGTLTETEWLESLKGEPGENGQDGKTPVLGVDYFTDEDKSNIKQYCDTYIDNQIGVIENGSY
jgi:hypothetical protein